MTDQEFLQQMHERLERLRVQQRNINEQVARDIGRGLRAGLALLSGSLALGLGLNWRK